MHKLWLVYAVVPHTAVSAMQKSSQLLAPHTPKPTGPPSRHCAAVADPVAACACSMRHPSVLPLVSVLDPVAHPNAAHASAQCVASAYCALVSMQFASMVVQYSVHVVGGGGATQVPPLHVPPPAQAAVLLVCVQECDELHASSVHTLPSSQSVTVAQHPPVVSGVCEQLNALEHASVVHALPSSQSVTVAQHPPVVSGVNTQA